jgi:hypothetical protein
VAAVRHVPLFVALALVAHASIAAPPSVAAPAPPPPRLVVLDVATEEKGIKPSTLAALADLVTVEVSRYERSPKGQQQQLDVLSGREIRDALKLEGERQSIGCDQQSCAGELAQAFGARYVAFLVLVRLGSAVTLNLSLFDSQNAAIVGRGSAQANTVAALAPALPGAVRALLANVVKVDAVPLARTPVERSPLDRVVAEKSNEPKSLGGSTASFPALHDDEVPLELVPLTVEHAAICAYDSVEDRWHCGGRDAEDGQRFALVEREKHGGAATHGVARFTPRVLGGCLESVEVELLSADEGVVVDWRDAVFVVNGEALAARPIRPVDRPMNAPPGAFAKETIVAATQRCVGGRTLAGKDSDVVALTLGFTVGGTPARAKWIRARNVGAVDERELLALLPTPELPPPPPDLVPEDAEGPTAWGTIGGIGAGSALGLVSGAFVGAAWMPASASLTDRLLAGSGYGALCAGLCGVPLVAGGLLADKASSSTFEAKVQASERWRAEKKRVAAFLRARGSDL